LTKWKRDAQRRAFRDLVAQGAGPPTEEAARIGSIITADNLGASNAGLERIFATVHAAADADLAAFMREPIWSNASVELTLRLDDDQKPPSFNISRLPLAVEIAPEVTIIALPGTGKTTTLLQLGRHVLASNSIVPLYFRLGDLTTSSLGLLATLRQRSAFRDV